MNSWQEYAVPILTDNTIHVLMVLLVLFDRWKSCSVYTKERPHPWNMEEWKRRKLP